MIYNCRMSSRKTTLISHIFNEEYLLPFWLEHHKNMFDQIIIIDYRSTDLSVEICKRICPDCIIITTRNSDFCADLVDKEVMDIEQSIEGIKMVLNTTEFLVCEIPVKEIFEGSIHSMSYSITAVSPYSINNYTITNYSELFKNLLNTDVAYWHDRGVRQLHNFPNGNYHCGRHNTNNISTPTNNAHIIWVGYYPMNDTTLKRKLQIQHNIPQYDKDRGHGCQHLFSKDTILSINRDKAQTGALLKVLNESLYNFLRSQYP